MSLPTVLTEAVSSRNRPEKSEKQRAITANDVLHTIEQHVLLDGFKIVIDLEKSRGSYIHNAATNSRLIDLYGFFGSLPIGYNHSYFEQEDVKRDLLRAARIKVANSDIYSEGYARFVETFSRVAGLPPLERYLFIEGGALAIENTLKAAMDWKVRKNMAAGRGERGTDILHFRHAFHGRTGYTMSLTNTDPRKTDLFAKFNWPRVSNPHIDFSLPEGGADERCHRARTRSRSRKSGGRLRSAASTFVRSSSNRFRAKAATTIFAVNGCKKLREICDENEMLLIFDEVQAGWEQPAAPGVASISGSFPI